MKLRFPLFVLLLLASLAMTGYGFFGHRIDLYQKPAPEDAGPELPESLAFQVGEIVATDWARGERIRPDEYGHLIDTEQAGECFS